MRKKKRKGEMKMLQLIQSEEEIVLVNHTTGETREFIIRDLEEIEVIKEAQAAVDEGEFELEYLRGCLVGEACDYFLELCELAREHQELLTIVGKLFNACDGLEETALVLEAEDYAIIRAKTPALAFREYVEELGDLDSVPAYIRDYIDYEKWLNAVSVTVIQTDASTDELGRSEFVVYNLI